MPLQQGPSSRDHIDRTRPGDGDKHTEEKKNEDRKCRLVYLTLFFHFVSLSDPPTELLPQRGGEGGLVDNHGRGVRPSDHHPRVVGQVVEAASQGVELVEAPGIGAQVLNIFLSLKLVEGGNKGLKVDLVVSSGHDEGVLVGGGADPVHRVHRESR